MSTSKPRKGTKSAQRAYHHGNLRQALLDAALALVEADQEEPLSLRTVASRAGVSTGAPYRHFQDREALLAALAAVGFDRLLKSLVRARASANSAALLPALARAYLTFASRNKGLYALMFTENHLAVRFDEALARSSTAAFMELENAVSSRLTREGTQARLVATTIWATLHGVAMLTFERLIPAGGAADENQAREVGAAVVSLVIESIFRPAS